MGKEPAMNKLLNLVLILIISILFSCSEDIPNFVNDWDEDVYYFGKNLEENHIDLFFNISKSEFDDDINTLRDNTATLTEQEILIELSGIISKIGDSHTQLQFSHKLTILPFKVLWLDDGLLLTEVDIENEQHLGKRIIGINGIPIGEIIDMYRSVIAYENESNFKNQAVNYLLFKEFYQDFGIIDSLGEFTLKLEDGSDYILNTQTSQTIAIENASQPLFLKNINTFYRFEELTEDNIIYIQYNACRERSDLSFQSFTDQIANRIDGNNDIDKLVIDLRHNGGGNSTIMRPLINKLQNYIVENRFTKNQIYLIIGRKTFSSAILNTIELKEKLDNIIIGESSGGKPNHHGEVKKFRLPKSLLNVSYSTKYFELSPTDEDAITPDIPIEYSSDNYLNGVDPVLEKIKND